MSRFIGYGRQTIDEGDVEAVVRVLRGDYLTQGPAVDRFERDLAAYVGAKHAVAVSSGTAALHVACLAAGLGRGDHAVTQPLTFVASANAALYCGATCGLAEISSETLTMSPLALAASLAERPDTKVVIPVSFSGLSSGGTELRQAAGSRIIIEDASHSIGANREDGTRIGSPGWADMTVFSFHPVKPITTAEGGAVVTDDDELARRLRLARSHGIERLPDRFAQAGHDGDLWYYEQQELGFNYRLTDLQAALGASQLSRLDGFIARRRAIARHYDALFADEPAIRRYQDDDAARARSGHHLYVVGLDYGQLAKSRGEIMRRLRADGIGTQVHYIPVHHHPYHRNRLGPVNFPHSDAFYDKALSIPCFPGMTDDDVGRVARAVMAIARGEW